MNYNQGEKLALPSCRAETTRCTQSRCKKSGGLIRYISSILYPKWGGVHRTHNKKSRYGGESTVEIISIKLGRAIAL